MPPPQDPSLWTMSGLDPTVDLSRPLPQAGGGLPAYTVVARRAGTMDLMGLAIARNAPARSQAMQLLSEPIGNLLTPLGCVLGPTPDGGQAAYVVCPAPPGPPVSAGLRPWFEGALINQVLRPVAQVLDSVAMRGVTHRAIRPDNVFHGGKGRTVVLGAAWAAPPAMHQPPLFEPPYSAACHPAARGNGTIADDVYALGVLLIVLALGRLPLAELDDTALLHRKLESGSYAALTQNERLPPAIGELVRGMLAEDPDHRPSPLMLLDPAAARGRRIAARSPRRAPRALQVGTTSVWDARTLAHAIGREPEAGIQALRSSEMMQWLRRGLGDPALAVRVEELMRHQDRAGQGSAGRTDAEIVLHVVALIDPLAPLYWRGTGLWPDGLGCALAAGQAGDAALLGLLEEAITAEVVGTWAMLRADRCDFMTLKQEARQQRGWLRLRGHTGGVIRLTYVLNPLLPCASPLLGRHWVARMPELLPALEAAAGASGLGSDPVDSHIMAFVAARSDRRIEAELNALDNAPSPEARARSRLELMAHLQTRYCPRPLPALAAWLAANADALVTEWHNRPRRTEIAARLQALASDGLLAPMVALLDDPSARTADRTGAQAAEAEHTRIGNELATLANGAEARKRQAVWLGHEIAAGLGVATVTLMLILAALG